MSAKKTKTESFKIQRLLAPLAALALVLTATAYAAVPGITGPTFNLTARAAYISQPDGEANYSWGYGCIGVPSGFAPRPGFGPGSLNLPNANCPSMQVPGPSLIVTEGQTVTVNLTNNLPNAAGNTSILFPGFNVTATGGVAGLLTREAAPGGSVQYSFVASTPGTRAYYSGTQGDLQIEMGLYGAIIVLPATIPSSCTSGIAASNQAARAAHGEGDFRLAAAAYNHPKACYDREYIFQLSALDSAIHRQADAQVRAKTGCVAGAAGCSLNVATEPYHPTYFLINGRSMPDLMDPEYAVNFPHQPYSTYPQLHPGEQVLFRIIGEGRWQHPFHQHGNHARVLARDGNLILSVTNPALNLAGPVLFTTSTTPGQAVDEIYYWTSKGLNWDPFGHNSASANPLAKPACVPDAEGYYTSNPAAPNYFEWCQDHFKPLEQAPTGDVPAGGPVTLPYPNILTAGPWYGGSAYLGPEATVRATGPTSTIPPSGTVSNSPLEQAAFMFMFHSHNERELTTNNIFPGGMMTMMLVHSREFVIDESW